MRLLENDDRCGRMATAVIPENVSKIDSLVKMDPIMTCAELCQIKKILLGRITCILLDCLGVRKRCAGWVHHNLSEEQKWGLVDWNTHMPRKFGRFPHVWGVVAGDKTRLRVSIQTRDEATVGGVDLPS